jgi:KDO transferase-3
MRLWNYLACRLWRPRDYWHNRHFDGRYQAVEESPGRWAVTWKGGMVPTRTLAELAGLPHPPRCNIIASGPSLAMVRHPERLFNDFTICMNGSFRLAQQVNRTCDLYITSDGGFIRRRFGDFCEGLGVSNHLLIDHLMLFFLLERDPELAFRANAFLYDDPNRPYLSRGVERAAALSRMFKPGVDFIPNPRNGELLISRNPAVGISRTSSVVGTALQAAWMMGFKEVRLYGMDLGGPARFYAEGAKAEPTRLERDYEEFLLPWFKEFASKCCGPDFRVFNCSETSRLPAEVLPKLDPNAD